MSLWNKKEIPVRLESPPSSSAEISTCGDGQSRKLSAVNASQANITKLTPKTKQKKNKKRSANSGQYTLTELEMCLLGYVDFYGALIADQLKILLNGGFKGDGNSLFKSINRLKKQGLLTLHRFGRAEEKLDFFQLTQSGKQALAGSLDIPLTMLGESKIFRMPECGRQYAFKICNDFFARAYSENNEQVKVLDSFSFCDHSRRNNGKLESFTRVNSGKITKSFHGIFGLRNGDTDVICAIVVDTLIPLPYHLAKIKDKSLIALLSPISEEQKSELHGKFSTLLNASFCEECFVLFLAHSQERIAQLASALKALGHDNGVLFTVIDKLREGVFSGIWTDMQGKQNCYLANIFSS